MYECQAVILDYFYSEIYFILVRTIYTHNHIYCLSVVIIILRQNQHLKY